MKRSGLPINLDDLIHHRVIENERLEFKASWNEATKPAILRTISAFANDLLNTNGGYIIIGIDEENGRPQLPPKGLQNLDLDKIQKSLFGSCKGAISPEYLPMVYFETFMEKEIMIIWCPAGENRPYQAPSRKGEGKVYWIRSSGVTMEARGDLNRQLMEHAGKIPFDDRRSLSGTIEDVSPEFLDRFLKEIRSDIPHLNLPHHEICDKLRLMVPINSHKVPRNIALMFFNIEPKNFFQGCYIEVAHFPEGAGGDIITERTFNGPINQQIRACLNYLKGIGGALIQKRPDKAEADHFLPYPYEAVEEILVNAAFHRSYEYPPEPVKIYIYPNRIEITSYPGPLPGIKQEHLDKGSTPSLPHRNRRIGDFLKELRLAEAKGTGIPKIIKAMKNNGSPPPQFDFDEQRTYFRVTLPIHPRHEELLTKTNLQNGGDISNGSHAANGDTETISTGPPRTIFTFGSIGAGKSTLMATLSTILYKKHPLRFSMESHEGNRLLLNNWLEPLKQMSFPPRSRVGDIFEVQMEFILKEPQNLQLNFLEMSGEDLTRLDLRAREGTLDEKFIKYARKTEIFLIVAPYDKGAKDDLLVTQFFSLLQKENIDMSRLILIISKWDLNTGAQKVHEFVQAQMPQTYNWLKSLYKEKLPIFPFSIGNVKENKIQELNLSQSEEILEQLLRF